MEITKQLFFNLSLLLVIQFFFQVWVDSCGNRTISRPIVSIYLLLSVLCNICLSIEVSNDFRFDLRQLPFTIGGLYGSPWVITFLYTATLIIRAFYGVNTGFWMNNLVFGLLAILVMIGRSRFLLLSLKQKVLVSVIISICSSLCLLLAFDLTHIPLTTGKLIFNYIFIPALGTGIMTYTVESWLKNRYLQKQIFKTEKMDIIAHLSASIAHEIRNPLTTVRGFLQLVKMNEFTNEKRMEFADISLKEIDQAESIISDFLTFARPSINQIEVLDVCKEIKQVLNIIKPLANMNSVELSTEFASFGFIRGDKTLFQQCLINLCKNALEAMENGGFLTISTYHDHKSVIIKVSDTGIGMTEEQLSHLGEPYFSLNGNKGTGLGVMVIYSIVNAFHGKIEAESTLGVGTTFTLALPLVSFQALKEYDSGMYSESYQEKKQVSSVD